MYHELDSVINIRMLLWLFPFVFLVHDLEEVLMIEGFMIKHKQLVMSRLPARLGALVLKSLSMRSSQFSAAVSVIFLFVLTVTILGVRSLDGQGNIKFFAAALTVFFVHVFTHVGQSLTVRRLTPGVITAVIFVLPYSWYTFHRLFQHNLITWKLIYAAAPWGLLIMPIVFTAHLIGRKVFR